jgi:hypothetical protein
MYPTDVMARERISDRVREGERERRSRGPAQARAFARRARIRGGLNLVAGTFALARRRRVAHPA